LGLFFFISDENVAGWVKEKLRLLKSIYFVGRWREVTDSSLSNQIMD